MGETGAFDGRRRSLSGAFKAHPIAVAAAAKALPRHQPAAWMHRRAADRRASPQ
jgi:hypothetical protein